MSTFFGASPLVGDFFISYRWSNIFRRVLGEGGVSNGFIPVYEKYRQENPMKGDLFFRDLFWTLLTIMVPLIGAIVWFCSGSILSFMLPGVVFIVFYALFMAYLQCHGYFFLPSVAPTIFNIIWIGGCFVFAPYPESFALKGIAAIISIAFFFQWIVLVPKTFKCLTLSFKEWLQFRPFSSDVLVLLKPLSLTLIGIAATQLNGTIDLLFAKYADPKGAAFLGYAIKLEQVPMALFGVAVSQAIAPLLARAYQNKEYDTVDQLSQKSLQITLKLLAPFTLLFLIAAPPFVSLIYGHGAFMDQDVQQTSLALCMYTLGLIPSGLILLLAPCYYACNDFKTPTKATILAVTTNTILNALLVFVFDMNASAIALTTSISFWVQWGYLVAKLPTKFSTKNLFREIGLILAIVMVCFYLDPNIYLQNSYPKLWLDKFLMLGKSVLVPAILYAFAYFFIKESPIVENRGKSVEEKNITAKNNL